MNGHRRSRRDVLTGLTGVAGVVAAGCLDRVPVLGSDPAPSVDPMPVDAVAFVTVDVATLLESDPLRGLLDDAVPLTDVDGLSGTVDGRTGLDPREVETASAFLTPGAEMSGGVIDAAWDTDDVVSAIESQGRTPAETTLEGVPAYTFETTDLTVSSLPDGRTVAGVGGATGAIIATDAGSKAGIAAGVRRAYGRVPSGPVGFAIDAGNAGEGTITTVTRELPRFARDVVDSIRFVAGSLSVVEGRPRITVQVTGNDGTGARQLKEYVEAIPPLLDRRLDDDAISDALDEATISRDGTRVTVTLLGRETVQPLVDTVIRRIALSALSPPLS